MLPFIFSNIFVCLFELFRSTREFLTHMETSSLPVKDCKFWLMLGIHSYWAVRFFSASHLLRHGAFVYNGHLRGPWHSHLLPSVLRVVVLSLLVFTTKIYRCWDSNTQTSACMANALTHSATTAVFQHINNSQSFMHIMLQMKIEMFTCSWNNIKKELMNNFLQVILQKREK